MTVAELLNRISARELAEWMAFYQLEPFGEIRSDWRSGMQAALFANANRDSKTRPFNVSDFMFPDIYSRQRTRPPQDPDERAKKVSQSLYFVMDSIAVKKKL